MAAIVLVSQPGAACSTSQSGQSLGETVIYRPCSSAFDCQGPGDDVAFLWLHRRARAVKSACRSSTRFSASFLVGYPFVACAAPRAERTSWNDSRTLVLGSGRAARARRRLQRVACGRADTGGWRELRQQRQWRQRRFVPGWADDLRRLVRDAVERRATLRRLQQRLPGRQRVLRRDVHVPGRVVRLRQRLLESCDRCAELRRLRGRVWGGSGVQQRLLQLSCGAFELRRSVR